MAVYPKITLLLLTGLYLSAAPLAAQNAAPSWYLEKESAYPSRAYIAAVGEGKTRAEAETAAVAQISLFFNTSTQVRNEAIREFNEAVTNNTTEFSKKTYITENAVIKSEEEFLGVRFADPWQDAMRGIWAALAYVDRREAAQIYDSKISTNMAVINALASDADGEAEPLYAASLLYRALRICDITEECIKTAVVVDPAAGRKYEVHTAKIQELRSNYRAKREDLSFTVTVQSPENSGRLERKLNALLEDSGYVVTAGNSSYTVSARLTGEESTGSVGNFVTPGLIIRIERGGKTLFSYSKTYDRSGHRTSMNTAYTRALVGIEQDLEENFIRQFTAMLGR